MTPTTFADAGNESFTRRKNLTATSVTVGLHVLILLLLLIWKYTPAIQIPVRELGMEVNLGTGDEGMGDDQPEEPGMPARAAAAASVPTPEDEGVQTDDNNPENDAPEVAPKPRPTPVKPKQTSLTPVPAKANPAPAPKPKYTYDGSDGPGGNGAQNSRPGSGEGISGRPGDQGVPGGTPGASNYTGSPGPGTGGISHSLGSRSIIDKGQKAWEFRTGGKVKVKVRVNCDGRITIVDVVSNSNELRALARKRLEGVTFEKCKDGLPEQVGEVTIIFKTR